MWKQKAAEGLRYELEENGRIASFVFAGRDVVTKTDAEGHVTRFQHGYEILSCDSERARTYYHYACDELGSITHVVSGGGEDSAGSLSEDRVLNRYRYDAFGTTVSCEETVENCFRYTGGQYDPMTEQYYLKARFYNPAVARFTQEDTYYGDGLNLYAYCHNNPVSYVDPTGHEAKAAAEKNPGSTSQRTPDQQALYDLVDEQNKLGGHDSTDQKTIRDWADKYGVDYDDLGVKLKESGTTSISPRRVAAEQKLADAASGINNKAIDPVTGLEIDDLIIGDSRGNLIIAPKGGGFDLNRPNGVDVHSFYPNGSNYQRYNPIGHGSNTTPHGHGHAVGTGPNRRGQGDSLDVFGNIVPFNSPDAHWSIY